MPKRIMNKREMTKTGSRQVKPRVAALTDPQHGSPLPAPGQTALEPARLIKGAEAVMGPAREYESSVDMAPLDVATHIDGRGVNTSGISAIPQLYAETQTQTRPQTFNPKITAIANLHAFSSMGYMKTYQSDPRNPMTIEFQGWNATIDERRDILRYLAAERSFPVGLLSDITRRLSDNNPEQRMHAYMELAAIGSVPRGGGLVEQILREGNMSTDPTLWRFLEKARSDRLSSSASNLRWRYEKYGEELFNAARESDLATNLSSDLIKDSYHTSKLDAKTADDFATYVINTMQHQTEGTGYDLTSGLWDDIVAFGYQHTEAASVALAVSAGDDTPDKLPRPNHLGMKLLQYVFYQMGAGSGKAMIATAKKRTDFPPNIAVSITRSSEIVNQMWGERFEYFEMARRRLPDASEDEVVKLAMAANLADKLHYNSPFYKFIPKTNTIEVTFRPSRIPVTVDMYTELRKEAVIPHLMRRDNLETEQATMIVRGEALLYEPVWTDDVREDGERGGFYLKTAAGDYVTDPEDGTPIIWTPKKDKKLQKKDEVYREMLDKVRDLGKADFNRRGREPHKSMRLLPLPTRVNPFNVMGMF